MKLINVDKLISTLNSGEELKSLSESVHDSRFIKILQDTPYIILDINRMKLSLKHGKERLTALKNRQDSLSVWGYRDMGYYEGRISVLEDLLDELEEDEI
jgi:hypothetical protein